MSTNIDYCLDVVKQKRPDLYAVQLFMPEEARSGIVALYAFQSEIGAISDMVQEPMAGEIRLQWWRDVLSPDNLATGAPIADALNAAIRIYDLPLTAFNSLLDARIFDLYSDCMPSLNDAEGYAGEAYSIIYQLSAQILDEVAGHNFAAKKYSDLSGHCGVAEFWTHIACELPKQLSKRQYFIPREMLQQHDIDADAVLAGDFSAELVNKMRGIAVEQAQQNLQKISALKTDMPKEQRRFMLPMALHHKKLDKVARATPTQIVSQINPLAQLWTLWRET